MASVIALLLLLLMCIVNYSEENSYRIQHHCKRTLCFQLWSPDGVDMALVTNGQIQSAAAAEAEETKCVLPITAFTNQDLHCRRNPCSFEGSCSLSFPSSGFINTKPKQNVSLQCALLSSLTTSSCFSERLRGFLAVAWVDDSGNLVEEGPEFSLSRNSACDATLTVSFRSPKNASFRCLAGLNERTWTSEKIGVRLPPPPRGGRRGPVGVKPQPEGESGGEAEGNPVVGPTVGVLSALLLMAAALYVLNKRRTNPPTSNESPSSTADCEDSDSDDVVYADVVFPDAPSRVFVSDNETTVYANVRFT